MPAYWIGRSKINDPAEYKKYTDQVPAILAKHGGKVLVRGGRYEIMEGPEKFHRFIVIEFPTLRGASPASTPRNTSGRRPSVGPGPAKWRSSWPKAGMRPNRA